MDNFTDEEKICLMIHAARRGEIDRVKTFVTSQNVQPNSRGSGGFTALHIAANHGYIEIVRFLIARNAIVNVQSDDGLTPLHEACVSDNLDVARLLVDSGSFIFTKSQKGQTALELARQKGDNFVSALLPNLVKGTCLVCDCDTALLVLSSCGHKYCLVCLRDWFVSLLADSVPLRCPDRHCKEQPLQYDLRCSLPDRDYLRWEDQDLRRAFLQTTDFHWCGTCSSGGFLWSADDIHGCPCVQCPHCPATWCKLCKFEFHGEMTCEEAKVERDTRTEETRLSEEWKSKNSKGCPRCKADIEKTGGCSHVTCRMCRYQFCWICMQKYSGVYTQDTDNCPCKKES